MFTKQLRKAVIEVIAKAKDDPRKAEDLLIKTSSAEIRKTLLVLGARQAVRDYFYDQRQSAMSMAAGRVQANLDNPKVAERLTQRIARHVFWDMYTLFGMSSLKTATRPDLIKSAEERETQAKGLLRFASFERAIAKKMPNDTVTVQRCLTIGEIEKIARRFKADLE